MWSFRSNSDLGSAATETANRRRAAAELASGLVNSTKQIGGALGIAILSTVALSAVFAEALLVAAAFAVAGVGYKMGTNLVVCIVNYTPRRWTRQLTMRTTNVDGRARACHAAAQLFSRRCAI